MHFQTGIEDDEDVRAALSWLAEVSGAPAAFKRRLRQAQRAYTEYTGDIAHKGRDPSLSVLGPDIVASFFAQSQSMLDDRRSFDPALASRCIPWIKQIGANADALSNVPGAAERARRMLEDAATAPDGTVFELVMAGNYAAHGEDVILVPEQPGKSKTPDIHLAVEGRTERVAVECKRLRAGQYEVEERELQRGIFRRAAELIEKWRLSLHIDVNYVVELSYVPESYLADWLKRFLSATVIMPGHYPWNDEFGSGEIRPANTAAVLEEIEDSSLYFGTKFARMLSGNAVRENGYNLAAGLRPDVRDPRYFKGFEYGSVVTWQCTAPSAIDRKARHVKSKLAEAGRQVSTQRVGVIHLAMDAEPDCESSDLRRQRNMAVISEFRAESIVAALYVHYIVPRISETHAWLVDETVDKFSHGGEPPAMMIFSNSRPVDNDLPAWKQTLAVPRPPVGG